jgi:hypothetical protein
VDFYFACILLVKPDQYLHQRGLSGPVLPDETDDLVAVDCKIDGVKCPHSWKALVDPLHFNNQLIAH